MLGLMALELAVPPWAMAATMRQLLHARHVKERFGLFAKTAMKESLEPQAMVPLIVIGAATLVSAFCVWWLYFDGRPLPDDRSCALWWAHGHLVVFAAMGAMGAGAEMAVQAQVDALLFDLPMRAAVVLPAGLSLVALAWIHSVAPGEVTKAVTRVIAAIAVVIAGRRPQRGSHHPGSSTQHRRTETRPRA